MPESSSYLTPKEAANLGKTVRGSYNSLTGSFAAEIAAFVKERNDVLLRADLDEVMAFQKKHNPSMPAFLMSRRIGEVGMHKAITATPSLPRPHRLKSKRWLTERGYKSLDDGDLNDAQIDQN